MTRFPKILISLAAILLVAIAALWLSVPYLIPKFVDTKDIISKIEAGLYESLGIQFLVKDLRIKPTVFDGLHVQLSSNRIYDLKGRDIGNVDLADIKVSYIPLITEQKVIIKRIHLVRPVLPVREASLFNQITLKLEDPDKPKVAELVDATIIASDYVITDYSIAEHNNLILDQAKTFVVKGSRLTLEHLLDNNPDTPLKLSMRGKIYFDPQDKTNIATHYDLQLRLPEEEIKQETKEANGFGWDDIEQLHLKLSEKDVAVNLNMQRGEGRLKTNASSLLALEAIYHQLSDTFDLPVPPIAQDSYVAGQMSGDLGFNLNPLKKQEMPLLNGYLALKEVALSDRSDFKNPLIDKMTGRINFKQRLVTLKDLMVLLDESRFTLNGWYQLDTQKMDMHTVGKNLDIASLKLTAQRLAHVLKLNIPNLDQYQLTGRTDINLRLAGTPNNLGYGGQIALRQGRYRDRQTGLVLSNLLARIDIGSIIRVKTLQGMAGSTPFAVTGQIARNFNSYSLELISRNVNLQRFHDEILARIPQIQGQLSQFGTPTGHGDANLYLTKTPQQVQPNYHGTVRVADTSYTDPQTNLTVTNISGLVNIGRQIVLENFQGFLGSSRFSVNGNISKTFDDYRLNLSSGNINIQNFFDEVLAKLPAFQDDLAQLQSARGTGQVNLVVTDEAGITGTIDLNQLIVRAGGLGTDIRIPHAVIRMTGNDIFIDQTRGSFGPVGFIAQGQASLGGLFNFKVNTGQTPMSLLREEPEFISNLTGFPLPPIWNTAGTFDFNGTLTQERVDGVLALNNAGLSWQGGQFPLYAMNGQLKLSKVGSGDPVVETNQLTAKYGNSPILITANYDGKLHVRGEGILSPLLVNHTLMSSQNVSQPYGEIPFNFSVDGDTAAILPAEGKNSPAHTLTASLFAGLDSLFAPRLRPSLAATLPQASVYTAAESSPAQLALITNRVDRQAIRQNAVSARPQSMNTPVQATSAQTVRHEQRNEGQSAIRESAPVPDTHSTLDAEPTLRGISPTHGSLNAEELAKEPDANATDKSKAEAANKFPRSAPSFEDLTDYTLPNAKRDTSLETFLTLQDSQLLLNKFILQLGDSGELQANGYLDSIMVPDAYAFHVVTMPELDFTQMNGVFDRPTFENAQGSVATDLIVRGSISDGADAEGWLEMNGLQLPALQIRNLTGEVDFSGDGAAIDIASFNVPGVEVGMKAQAPDISTLPVELEDVEITGSRFVVSAFNDFNTNIINGILVKKFLDQYAPSSSTRTSMLPFQFRGGKVALNEVIYQNIILDDVKGDMSMFPNGFLELENLDLQAAGGHVDGYLSISPADKYVSLDIKTEDVKANALTKALLNVTNTIFGNIDSTVRFTTQGETEDEMMENANGTVNFVVRDGRLPAIAKVETLLTAANIVRGGVLGFNLNNLFRTVASYNTNYFAEMSGSFQIAEGTLHTNDLVSDGQNLDLFIEGNIEMKDGTADLLVNGLMSQDVSGELGALGKLSLGSIVRWIPGVGFIPGGEQKRSGIIQHIPFLGYIPGLGGAPEKYNRFQVRLEGNVDDPDAIKDFSWVRSRSL